MTKDRNILVTFTLPIYLTWRKVIIFPPGLNASVLVFLYFHHQPMISLRSIPYLACFSDLITVFPHQQGAFYVRRGNLPPVSLTCRVRRSSVVLSYISTISVISQPFAILSYENGLYMGVMTLFFTCIKFWWTSSDQLSPKSMVENGILYRTLDLLNRLAWALAQWNRCGIKGYVCTNPYHC